MVAPPCCRNPLHDDSIPYQLYDFWYRAFTDISRVYEWPHEDKVPYIQRTGIPALRRESVPDSATNPLV